MAKGGIGRPKKHNYSRLSDPEKGEIIAYIKLGMGNKQIARLMHRAPSTIRECRKKYEETKKIEDSPRSGRPRITTAAEDRALKFKSLKNRWLTAVDLRRTTITKQGRRPCVRTVRNRLREVGLNGRIAAKKPLINWKQQLNRLAWAKKYEKWTKQDWRQVIFSDESPFTLMSRCGKVWVRRRAEIGRAVQQECRDRSRMPSSA
eukprot:TRINITY_DN9600_c0_g1_i1.p1 TRINITY_DN9600_c0_g1~~TRINITY_DN9600_c0_g1_i1.p1  ORF type:complete len:204 (+),score=8.08 TRINITY_DN9600_c0_g1_i1:205-816(+)